MNYNRYVDFRERGIAKPKTSVFLTGLRFLVLTILFCGSIVFTTIAQDASADTTETGEGETEMAEEQGGDAQAANEQEESKPFLQRIFPFLGGDSGEGEGNPYADYTLEELNEALLEEARNQNIDELVRIIEEGARINAENDHGRNALIEAARLGHIEVVKTLIKYGATLNARDDYDGSALDYAEKEGHTEIAYILQKNGARR